MAERNIVTQDGLVDLKFQLQEVAENLSAHINASLSKAHGVVVLQGYTDADGNDLTTYQDSVGDILGNYFIRFTVDNVHYYAAAITTALAGQDESTGSIDTGEEDDFQSVGGSAWVTNYVSQQAADAEAINTDVIIPHTRNPHWDAHGSLTILNTPTYDTDGHQIGTHIVRMRIGGNVYNIPVCDRFGGPLQVPRIGSIPPSVSVDFDSGEGNDVDIPLTLTVSGGTRPYAYHWQYFNTTTGLWTDITPAGSGSLSVPGWDSGIEYQWASTSTATFRITEANPGSDVTASMALRCRVTNPAVADSGATSGVISNNCIFTATDETGDCFITTAVCSATGLGDDNEYLQVLRGFRDTFMQRGKFRRGLLEDYEKIGPAIVRNIKRLPDRDIECTRLFVKYIMPACTAIKAGKQWKALALYCRMVLNLRSKFTKLAARQRK
jgi:hypothetical protein